MRVGIICLSHESNTFVPFPTGIDAFRRHLLLTGPDARKQFTWKHHEVMGFFDGLEKDGVDAVPVLITSAIPSGTIAHAALEELLALLQQQLSVCGPLDGVLVAPHGAAVSENVRDVDGHWLSKVRQHVGAEVPIIGTLDAHANLSPLMIQSTDALVAYRTNPHLDQYARGREAARLMVAALRKEVRPVQAAAFPPVMINIERQLTSEPQCREMYDLADAVLTQPHVLSNSMLLGFPYADVAEMGSSFVVVTDSDRELAQQYADELAAALWIRRENFRGQLISPDDAIRVAVEAPSRVCLLDMGDNVGGGSPGDGTILAHALLAESIGPSFVCLFDPDSVRKAQSAGAGHRVTLEMGGKTNDCHGPPLQAAVKVLRIHDGRFTESAVRHGGMLTFDMGATAIVQSDRGLTIMLTTQRVFPTSLGQLTSCGLDPAAFRILIAKGVHAPVAAYRPVCKTMIRVNTPGDTTADMTTLTYQHRRRPLFPFE
jgi:microcystin degradation protein MlrC